MQSSTQLSTPINYTYYAIYTVGMCVVWPHRSVFSPGVSYASFNYYSMLIGWLSIQPPPPPPLWDNNDSHNMKIPSKQCPHFNRVFVKFPQPAIDPHSYFFVSPRTGQVHCTERHNKRSYQCLANHSPEHTTTRRSTEPPPPLWYPLRPVALIHSGCVFVCPWKSLFYVKYLHSFWLGFSHAHVEWKNLWLARCVL